MNQPTPPPSRWTDPGDPNFNPLVNEPFADPKVVEGGGIHYRDQLILVNVDDVDLVHEELRELGAVIEPVDEAVNKYVVVYRIPPELDVLDVVRRLRARPGREPRVGPNHVIFGEPNYHGGPYGDPPPAPPIPAVQPTGGYSATVAVLDTGLIPVASLPPLLANRIVANPAPDIDAVVDTAGLIDVQGGHGTMVAGVIARLAPDARLVIIKVLPSGGATDEVNALGQLDRALTAKAEVINASWGTHGYLTQPPTGLDSFVSRLPGHVSMVAAAGNGRTTLPSYPAAFKRVVGVAALDTTGTGIGPAYAFTNFGSWVDACAPGVNVHSVYATGERRRRTPPLNLVPFQGWAAWSGTSFAAPVVTGLIAAAMTNYRAVDTQQALLTGPGAYTQPGFGTRLLPPFAITSP
jgi:subtilisin family serine protease